MNGDLRAFAYTFAMGALACWGFSERLSALSARAERNDIRAELQLQQFSHDAEISNAKAIVSRAVQDNRTMAEYVTQLQGHFRKYASPLADCYTTSEKSSYTTGGSK